MLGLLHGIPCLHPAPLQCPSVSGHCVKPGTDKVGQRTTGCNTTSELRYGSLTTVSRCEPDKVCTCLSAFFKGILLLTIDLTWIFWCLLALWCEDSPESRAFLDAVSSLKRLRENCQTEVHLMGNEEEVSNHQTSDLVSSSSVDVTSLLYHPLNLFDSQKILLPLSPVHFKPQYFLFFLNV